MERYCRVCGRHRPHEQFGGCGQRAIVCRTCRRLPREQRMRALWLDEVYGFLEQSNISKKNLRRLGQLETVEIVDVALLAGLVRQIAEVHPRKRKRWKRLRQQHRGLFRQAVDAGITDFNDPPDSGRDELDEFPAVPEVDWGVWIAPLYSSQQQFCRQQSRSHCSFITEARREGRMRFECKSKYYPKPFEPNDLIRPHLIDVVVGTESGDETTAARLAVDFLDLRHAEDAGYSILHVCDADSAGWTHVFEAIIEPAVDFAELRQDFGFDDPVNGLLFLYRSIFHPTLRDWQRFIIDGVCAMFPSDTAMIMARNELELSEKDLASLGFRIVAGSDFLFRPNMLRNEYSSVADVRDPSAISCPPETGDSIDEQWGVLD